MKSLKSGLIILGSVGLLFLGACGNNKPTDSGSSSPVASSPENPGKTETTAKIDSSNKASSSQKGGQVVESGKYHLEFVSGKEANGTHLDFYLQKGDNHETIPDAKVTAQIQLPDGTQKTLPLTYDASGKHYAALLSEKAAGQYQVKMIAEINGEKVDGRFNFSQ
ncbi:MAG: hypothetical protein WBG73_01425 [Coleofasciculaceae cyanobacterium]